MNRERGKRGEKEEGVRGNEGGNEKRVRETMEIFAHPAQILKCKGEELF